MVQALSAQNDGYTSKITELEAQIHTEQTTASEASTKHKSDIEAFMRRCDGLKMSQAAYEETAKRLDDIQKVIAAQEQGGKSLQIARRVRRRMSRLQRSRQRLLRSKKNKPSSSSRRQRQPLDRLLRSFSRRRLRWLAREIAQMFVQREHAVVSQEKVSAPRIDTSEKLTLIPASEALPKVHTTQEAVPVSKKKVVGKLEPVQETEKIDGVQEVI
jgi:hypothetical protein